MDETTRNIWKSGYNTALIELIDFFSEFQSSEEFYVGDIKEILEKRRKRNERSTI